MDAPWRLEPDGFEFAAHPLPQAVLQPLIAALEALPPRDTIRQNRGQTYAIRNLVQEIPEAAALAASAPIRTLVEPHLGPQARVVRSLLFDKNPAANWKVPWHQDLTIVVRERHDVPGFGPWSVKSGLLHVIPPAHVLASLLTLRLHLDDCHADNGALRVLPGSHRHGRLESADIERLRQTITPVVCEMSPGGILLMRPLLLHASSPAHRPAHRRILHLEFAAHPLPAGLQWAA